MEGKIGRPGLMMVGAVLFGIATSVQAQTPAQVPQRAGQAELNLRKSVNTREYRGQEVQGEERQIGRGDSLWRILVEEKGLPGKQFRSYLVVIRGLNPEMKNLDVLRVGDKIFIPLRVEDLTEGAAKATVAAADRPPVGRGATVDYRVKSGEHLYQILREQLKVGEERKLAQYYALVKDLNPERKNWDTLVEGEIIRLPTAGGTPVTTANAPVKPAEAKSASETIAAQTPRPPVEPKTVIAPPPAAPKPPDHRAVLKAPAKENLALFATVVEAMGGQMQQSGEEVVSLKEGTVRFDKNNYPVVSNPVLGQRVVIDPDDKIPASLRGKLSDPSVGAQVLTMSNGVSVQEAVGQLLAQLGYQQLPSDRPVIIQEEGIAYEAKGNWVALAPEQHNKTQEVYVINLTDGSGDVPDYLKTQLANRGLHLRDVRMTSSSDGTNTEPPQPPKDFVGQTKNWPRDKKEMIDALLLSYKIPFGVAETLSVELSDGLKIDARIDRVFEQNGKRTALFFQRADPEIKKALQEKQGVRTVELDVASLSSRDLITRTLTLLGDQASYREHRFAAARGSASERLTVTAWGFHLAKHSMFVTDRQIPQSLHRFFFEKGLEIIYFQ